MASSPGRSAGAARGTHLEGNGGASCTRPAPSRRGRADGLDYAVNLVELDLSGNRVACLPRLASLQRLEVLDLRGIRAERILSRSKGIYAGQD